MRDGIPCKPFIVYPHERIPTSINDEFPHDKARLTGTENGWMTGPAFCIFLHAVAEDAIAGGTKMPGEKVVLFVDNHSSHLNIEFCKTTGQLGIILIPLPANTTFLSQPCDVSCFKPLKSKWRKEINKIDS